jgi:GNAT superfamily N-acetyltransferase
MIQTYIQALSPGSRQNRFLGSVNELSANELYRMTHADSRARPEALLAEKIENAGRIMIGEARYALLPDGLSCEFAVSVAEAWRREELGTLLIGIVACRAKALGARYLAGDVLRSNEPMLKLARASGFTQTEPVTGAGLVRVTKDLSLVNAAQPCGMRSADSWMIAA